MNYILWLAWRQFYVDAGVSDPQVVVRKGVVLDANIQAARFGITLGMPLRQAQTLCHGVQSKEWEHDVFESKQRRWLDVCTDFAGVIEPIDQHVAALDLTSHPVPFFVADALICRLLREFALPLSYGAGPTKWIAELAAVSGEMTSSMDNPQDFLSGHSVRNLLPVAQEHRERLEFLGYSTIGEVAKIGLPVLQKQFGPDALLIDQAAKGGCFQPVRSSYPLDAIQEGLRFEPSVDDGMAIEAALEKLVTRLGRRLNGRQTTRLILRVEPEEGELIKNERTFTKPVYSVMSLRAAVKLLLSDVPSEVGAIASLKLTLLDLVEGRPIQSNLMSNDKRPLADAAIDHVRGTFGSGAVVLGRDVQTPRRERVLKAWGDALGWQ